MVVRLTSISWGDIVFNDLNTTRHGKSQSDQKNLSQCMTWGCSLRDGSWDYCWGGGVSLRPASYDLQLEDIQNQLITEVDQKDKLEGKTRQMGSELNNLRAMEKNYSKMEKAKRKLEEDLATYKVRRPPWHLPRTVWRGYTGGGVERVLRQSPTHSFVTHSLSHLLLTHPFTHLLLTHSGIEFLRVVLCWWGGGRVERTHSLTHSLTHSFITHSGRVTVRVVGPVGCLLVEPS